MPFVVKKFFTPVKQKAFLFLMQELGFTQKEAQRLIAKGRLIVDGVPMSRTAGFVTGEFELISFEPISRDLPPVFQTSDFAVFDKPSGVMVHPQNRHTPYSMIDEIKHYFGRDANIAHRIDQETSGLLLSSKNKQSEQTLKLLFENRKIQKRYLAFVHGQFSQDNSNINNSRFVKNHTDGSIIISAPLLRQKDDSAIVRMVVKVHDDGKRSQTIVSPLKYFPEQNITLVEARPLTGRQHQIRVHLFHVKHPIVGDPIYGQSEADIVRFLDKEISLDERLMKSGAKRLLLHASQLEFNHSGINYILKSKTDFLKEAFKFME